MACGEGRDGVQRDIYEFAVSASAPATSLTARQTEVLRLAVGGLSDKQIAHYLGISARTIEDHFSAMRRRIGAHSRSELIAYWVAAGLVKPGSALPETCFSGTGVMPTGSSGENRLGNQYRNGVPPDQLRDGIRDAGLVIIPPALDGSVRIGYARVSTRAQDDQAQLDALASAHCREIIAETASTRDDRPRLREALGKLQAGDTLVIYEPDRIARSMKELLLLLEDQLHAGGINLHILSGVYAGIHRPDGATIADKMLFMVAAMAAEMVRDLIRERTLDGLRAARGQGRRGGRPAAVNGDVLAIARARRERGESVTAIARHLGIGRSTLYRALDLGRDSAVPLAAGDTPVRQSGARPGSSWSQQPRSKLFRINSFTGIPQFWGTGVACEMTGGGLVFGFCGSGWCLENGGGRAALPARGRVILVPLSTGPE